MKRVRIATRQSALALAQSQGVARQLERALGCTSELVPLTTSGDRLADVSLARVGGKGLFVKEIEEALLEGRADLAVHSAKDLPAAAAPGLVLAAFPKRVDPRDALVARAPGATLLGLPAGARIGTGSARRASQLRTLRPDLAVEPLRGNVDTRLRRLVERELDAILLACAGLERLGRAAEIHERIDPALLLPAVGQGTLALQTRAGDPLAQALAPLDDVDTRMCLMAERAFLVALGGDCNVPLAAYAEPSADGLRLRALLASPDGSELLRSEGRGDRRDPEAVGREAGRRVLAEGGAALLERIRAGAGA